jgi:aspartokinase
MTEEKIKVGGIMVSDGRSLVQVLGVPPRPDAVGILLAAMGEEEINIEFLVESFDLDGYGNLCLCLDRRFLDDAVDICDEVKDQMAAKGITYRPEVSVISVYGPHFREKPRVSGIMFSALAAANVPSLAISTSISSVSCVVEEEYADLAAEVLAEAFEAPHVVRKRPKDY